VTRQSYGSKSNSCYKNSGKVWRWTKQARSTIKNSFWKINLGSCSPIQSAQLLINQVLTSDRNVLSLVAAGPRTPLEGFPIWFSSSDIPDSINNLDPTYHSQHPSSPTSSICSALVASSGLGSFLLVPDSKSSHGGKHSAAAPLIFSRCVVPAPDPIHCSCVLLAAGAGDGE
jgi:hypothetical protein